MWDVRGLHPLSPLLTRSPHPPISGASAQAQRPPGLRSQGLRPWEDAGVHLAQSRQVWLPRGHVPNSRACGGAEDRAVVPATGSALSACLGPPLPPPPAAPPWAPSQDTTVPPWRGGRGGKVAGSPGRGARPAGTASTRPGRCGPAWTLRTGWPPDPCGCSLTSHPAASQPGAGPAPGLQGRRGVHGQPGPGDRPAGAALPPRWRGCGGPGSHAWGAVREADGENGDSAAPRNNGRAKTNKLRAGWRKRR